MLENESPACKDVSELEDLLAGCCAEGDSGGREVVAEMLEILQLHHSFRVID